MGSSDGRGASGYVSAHAPLSPFAALAAARVLTLTACGDDGDEPSTKEDTSPSATESATDPKSTEPTDKGEPSESDDGIPNATDVCKALVAKDVSEIVGNSLEKGLVEGQGCLFTNPDNPTDTSIGINQASLATTGGIEGAKTAVSIFAKGKPEDLPDVGDDAFVVVGEGLVGTTAAGGAVAVGDALVQLNVTPSSDVSKADVKEQTIALLELVGDTL